MDTYMFDEAMRIADEKDKSKLKSKVVYVGLLDLRDEEDYIIPVVVRVFKDKQKAYQILASILEKIRQEDLEDCPEWEEKIEHQEYRGLNGFYYYNVEEAEIEY